MKKLYYLVFIINLVLCGSILYGMEHACDDQPCQETYYMILGVSNNATREEIEKAYKKMAFQYHPDKNYGNEKASEIRFKLIMTAYDILKDPKKKAEYDNSLHDNSSENDDFTNFSTNHSDNSFKNYGYACFYNMVEVLCSLCKQPEPSNAYYWWTSIGCCLPNNSFCYTCVSFLGDNEQCVKCPYCFSLISVVKAAYGTGFYNIKKLS